MHGLSSVILAKLESSCAVASWVMVSGLGLARERMASGHENARSSDMLPDGPICQPALPSSAVNSEGQQAVLARRQSFVASTISVPTPSFAVPGTLTFAPRRATAVAEVMPATLTLPEVASS